MNQVNAVAPQPLFEVQHDALQELDLEPGAFAPALASPFAVKSLQSVQQRDPFQIQAPRDIMQLVQVNEVLRNVKKISDGAQLQGLEFEKARLTERNTRQAEVRTKASEAASSQGFWSFLQKIGSFVLSVLSLVAGVFVSAANPLLGGIMIASAIVTLSSAVFQEVGGYDWVASKLSTDEKTRAAIRFILPLIVTLMTAAANIICIHQLGFNAVLQSLDTRGKVLEAFRIFALFVGGSSTIGEGLANARKSFADGELGYLKGIVKRSEGSMAGIGKSLEHMNSNMRKVTKNIGQMLDSHVATMRQLAQKV